MLKKLRIWVGALALAVLVTSGGVVATQAYTPPRTSPFTDVSTGHTFYQHISWLAEEGISTGYGSAPRRTFQPTAPVLREQMAAFLYRLADSPKYTPPARSPFTDVPTSHTFYKHISWLASEGISTGYALSGGRKEFRPSQPVLREQMAAFMYRFDGGTPHPDFPDPNMYQYYFTDVVGIGAQRPHAFQDEIRWLGNWDVTTGYGQGLHRTFAPSQPVLREQMAAFMFRLDHVLPYSAPMIDLPSRHELDLGREFGAVLLTSDGRAGTWSVDETSLPPGLVFTTDVIWGAPANGGSYPVAVTFTDNKGRVATHELVLVVVAPQDSATRSDLAQRLYTCSGSPEVDLPATSPFTDLPDTDPRYGTAVWARSQGLLGDAATFDPDAVVSRVFVADQLYRYYGQPPYSPPFHTPYVDIARVDPDYLAITWTTSRGYFDSDQDGNFGPHRPMTPAELTSLPLDCVTGLD